jgi:ribosomal protein S18 acetylase RimI-like enzyme
MTLTGTMDLATIAEVERAALQAWPGLEIVEVDGWLLRHAAGITRRANSVWPNEVRAGMALDAKMARVEEFYHARNLPVRFQICPAAQPPILDRLLAQHGFRAVARTAVQTMVLAEMMAHLAGRSTLIVELSAEPPEVWWDCYAKADEVSLESVAARKAICASIQVATVYAMVMLDGEVIAVGSAAVEGDWVGFFNVATLPEHRRLGAARALMAALGKWGQAQGATRAYLQVMANNEAALALYARLGFTTGYYYHYREEVRE